jgi:serine/threonine-protein kinase
VTYDGQVKVLDFGVAKAANRSTKTEAGGFKGKVSYMSPEQARGQAVDARSDVFALGIVLYELIGRCRLFQYSDLVEGLNAVGALTPIPSPITRNYEVPDALAEITLKALERDPARRYASARELQLALERWLSTPPGAPTRHQLSEYMRNLFAARIATQEKMLAAIRTGDDSAFKARPSQPEIPIPPAARKRRASRMPIIALVGAAIAVVTLGLFAGLRKPAPAPAPPPIEVAPASLSVDSKTPGAVVWVDGKELGGAPALLEEIEPGEHQVRAEAEGFEAETVTVNIARRGERTNLVVDLKTLPVQTPPPPPVPTPTPTPAPEAPSPVAKAAKGRLTLSTTPWAEVYEGGRKLGDSPLVDVPLSRFARAGAGRRLHVRPPAAALQRRRAVSRHVLLRVGNLPTVSDVR